MNKFDKIVAKGSVSVIALGLCCVSLPQLSYAQSNDTEAENQRDIVVTAQRREENLQDVPVSITAFGAEDLANRQIRDVNDLQAHAPNVFISTGTGTANSARIFFRGIGEDESRGAIDPAVGIYVDGVYLGRTVGSLLDVVDVERIEVLRGPQGTLYGRNTNGGAIKLISVKPQFENSADLEVGFGSQGRISARGVGNFAFTDSTAARVAVQYKERNGFHELIPNGDLANLARRVGDEQVLSLRGSLLHQFSEAWSASITLDYTEDDTDPTPSSIIAQSDDPSVITDADGDIFTVEPQPGVTCSSFAPLIFRPVGCFDEFSSSVEIFGAAINVDGQIGAFDIASITSYRALEDDLSTHITFPFFQNTDQEQFTQELTASSNFEGPFNFIAGVYYYKEDVRLDSTFFSNFRLGIDTQSYAAFGQGTFDITDRLTLTGGVRYTNEERDFIGENLSNRASATPFSPGSRVETLDTDNVTFTGKLDYSVTDNVLLYASYATGFKTPGFSPDCFSPTACFLPVEEENLNSIEGGLRSDFFDNRLRFNATYFYNDYDNLQISATVPGIGFTRSNAGAARIQGIEIESTLYATENLEIFGNFSWLDAEYRDLLPLQAETLTNAGAACPGIVAAGDPARATQIVDCALDLELKNAPSIKASIGFLYTTAFARGNISFGGNLAYEDDSFALVANPPGSVVQPGVTIDARINYQPDNGPWRVTLWSKNLTDREYFRATTSLNQVYAVPPRTWGLDLGVSF